jgi:hypothetical protein
LLVLVVVLFSLVVGYGWVRLLGTVLDPLMAGFVAALITVIALLLARMIGSAMAIGNAEPGYHVKLFFLYPILFIISALGTINAAFYNFEGSSVLLQVIDEAERNLAALDSAADTSLRNASQEERTASVERLLTRLRTEIINPSGNCGVGTEARKIIAQIQAILPQFGAYSQLRGRQSCDREALLNLYQAYRNDALSMLNSDPDLQNREGLKGALAKPIAAARERLVAAETGLTAGGGFGKGYSGAQLALEQAATTYAEGRERLAAARPEAAARLAPGIDVSRARYLGSITAMPGTLAARLNYFTTWVYFLIAIALDFFLIFLFVEGFRGTAPATVKPQQRSADPQFLWVNPEDE